MSSSDWISDTLFPVRQQYGEVYRNLQKLVYEGARAVKAEGDDEMHAYLFIMGLHFASMPNMASLFSLWVHEVYKEEEN